MSAEPWYSLKVPATAGWLTLNHRGAWYVHRPLIKNYRQLGMLLSLRDRLPRIQQANIIAELHFSTRRKRDPHNWQPTAKAILDGMVDAGVFPDDNSQHITGPDMREGAKVPVGAECIVMHIYPPS